MVQAANSNSTTPSANSDRRPTLAPTSLAQYLSLDSCDRFLRFYLYRGETRKLITRLSNIGLHQKRALQPFGPLLANLGDRVESGVIQSLRSRGYVVEDMDGQPVEVTLQALLKATDQPKYLYQAEISGLLGQWPFEGRADLIRIQRDEIGRLLVRVGDVKSTRKDKVQHRLQVSIYARLLQNMLHEAGEEALFEGTVIRRNPDSTLQDPESSARFDLEPYYQAIEQLAIAPDAALNRVDTTPLQDLHYYINYKCDGCLFNPVCMVESAERQDVALVPFMESADKRLLTQHGIRTVPQLAALKDLPVKPVDGTPPDRSLKVAAGQEATVAALSDSWPIGPHLNRLIQRAARMEQRLNPASKRLHYSYFFDSARSTLPDDTEYPDMVKIFLDAQTDYLEERVYLAGARIVGPKGVQSVVKMTPGIATAETERALLVQWVAEILGGVATVAADPSSLAVHLYLYNQHDQRNLLEALRRHLDVFASLPALYDLLTETPALTQSAVSFLYEEVKEQRNLGSTGHTLQTVSTQLGFKWNDGENRLYYRLFEHGMFDYLLKRQDNGQYVEAAARFFSTIPLEYAYAAWGLFKAEDFLPRQRSDVVPYLQVSVEQIKEFQAKRLEALAHIESHLGRKNRFIKKEPINWLALGATLGQTPPFRQVLEEFLYIEHFANLQDHLHLFAQPIIARVQQGRALLVRCVGVEETSYRGKQAVTALFETDFTGTGLEPSAALQLNKIKSGDFVVLNPLENEGQPWEIMRGRLCTVGNSAGSSLSLNLTTMNFFPVRGQTTPPFKYPHNAKLLPEVGDFYTIDEMVDDLNGDRLLEGCQNADFNPFYHLMAAPVGTGANRPVSESVSVRLKEFAHLIEELEGERAPTQAQQTVIAGHLARKILLVQGPPGTGKSHTLGWAVLARMYAERLGHNGHLRVAICCQTHNAVNIVLQSIASKLARLKDTSAAAVLKSLALYKSGGEETEENSLAGVETLDPWENRNRLSQILGSDLLVVGATPGGLHKLMKQHTKNAAKEAFWTTKPFDLVILDEASQMNLPQAVLATSWLQENGQLIVVGDHRQMAPILTHSWEVEDRLSAVTSQPYRSVFQYLLDQGFPRVALDESFRLHRLQAEFLHDQIYRHDGINFHSRRQQLLPASHDPNLSAYVQAVLDPLYPVVIIQHDEAHSQQANPTEAELIVPLVETCLEQLGLDGNEGVGVVVPHRAQKALLKARLPKLALWDGIDTVERFQGDEREVIIVSATASDPDYVLAEAEFLLNPNRLNVALSRPRKKLIVIASTTVFNFLSANLEIFEQAVLWKRLLKRCDQVLWTGTEAGSHVKVWGCKD